MTDIGEHNAGVATKLARLSQQDLVGRIWRKDHTVWKPDPAEITNRLGWLTVTDLMRGQISSLEAFAREVKEAGFHHVVLLGMGGSSLGAEVLRQALGSAREYPELIVLDSTVPAAVQSVADTINPAHTLFLVSSKSGTTTEPLALYRYFRGLVEAAGPENAGQNFVAITDPNTPLTEQAKEEGFRHTFLNPPDIGGRFSVLSYFGLVPAALIGIDIKELINQADNLREKCTPDVPAPENPGAWLGAYLGTLASQGRDKLTLVTSPAINSFGLWVEQLIAESTGKEGKGIIPVTGEPLTAMEHYDNDRMFVFLRLEGDDNAAMDTASGQIRASGIPVLTLELRDSYGLGAEFFRWEFATVIAGAMLGIHPFNQPDVQRAKDATAHLLQEYTTSGRLTRPDSPVSPAELLAQAGRGKYLAIMAYLLQTPQVDTLMAELRRRVLERYNIATSLGYGPRFLHSTGQLHKGGPDSVLCLQITASHERDLAIPGKPYTFGVVADAQALGDLEALRSSGRKATRVHFSRGDDTALAELIDELR